MYLLLKRGSKRPREWMVQSNWRLAAAKALCEAFSLSSTPLPHGMLQNEDALCHSQSHLSLRQSLDHRVWTAALQYLAVRDKTHGSNRRQDRWGKLLIGGIHLWLEAILLSFVRHYASIAILRSSKVFLESAGPRPSFPRPSSFLL